VTRLPSSPTRSSRSVRTRVSKATPYPPAPSACSRTAATKKSSAACATTTTSACSSRREAVRSSRQYGCAGRKSRTAELLGPGRTIVVRSFSDFRADPTSGDFASEIRLGEIGGRIGQAVQRRALDRQLVRRAGRHQAVRETVAQDGYYGPATIRIGNLQIAG